MSIHCKEGVYSKHYCLWNWLLLEMVQLMQRRQSLKYSVIGNKTFKVKDINYIRNLLYTWMKLEKDTISLWEFIVKRVFTLSSIAFKTGHFLEMVELVNGILSLQLTDVKNKIFKVKTLIKSATYFTHEWSCKKIRWFYEHSLWRGCLF